MPAHVHLADERDPGVGELLDRIALEYTILQEAYLEWGKGFTSHEEALAALGEFGISFNKEQQPHFTPFDSYWNKVTMGVVRALAREHYDRLKDASESLRAAPRHGNRNLYMLFFLHPGRHESWFYSERGHYDKGYASRVKREICHGRHYNLRTAWRYRADPTANPTKVKRCCTFVRRSLLLHSTTEDWWQADQEPPRESPECPCTDASLRQACRELSVTTTAGAAPTSLFNSWFACYAPCSINEGPIFRLRAGKSHLDCFDAVKAVLSDAEKRGTSEKTPETQERLRDELRGFYCITPVRES